MGIAELDAAPTVVLLLLGFPIALILAWAFDITAQGIRTTPRLQSALPTHRRRNIAILLLVDVIISGAAGLLLLPLASAEKMDKSIAVLPFENLSDDKENAFFADGIQDDILTNLSKIGLLGEKEAAIAEAKRATELLPESDDALEGPVITQALAEV